MYKAVIFDLDGVLVDACEWHRVALNMALKELSGYKISLEEHKNTFNGIPTLKKLDVLSKRGDIKSEDIEKIFVKKQQLTVEAIRKEGFIRKEKIELLEFLKSKNILIGCFTNSIKETATLMLEVTGIKEYFDLIITNEDIKNPKPSPEGYFYCMKYLKVNPNECIIVEDSDKGYEAAVSSGAKVVRVKDQEEVILSLLNEFFK
jgi:HAD superfamily hydrolase (TIGR01509 family)